MVSKKSHEVGMRNIGGMLDAAKDLRRMADRIVETGDVGLIRMAAGMLNDLRIEHEGGISDAMIDEAAWHAAVRDAGTGNLRISSVRECAGKSNTTQRGR